MKKEENEDISVRFEKLARETIQAFPVINEALSPALETCQRLRTEALTPEAPTRVIKGPFRSRRRRWVVFR